MSEHFADYPIFDARRVWRHKAIEMNIAFAHAMLEARRRGLEKFPLGPDPTPGTLGPYTFFERQVKISLIRSAAILCAENAMRDEMPDQMIPSTGMVMRP